MPTINETINFSQTEEEPKKEQNTVIKPLDEISPFSPRLNDVYAEALTLIGNDKTWEGFDALKNRYPAFSSQIDEMRRRGLSDFEIADGFRNRVEPFVNFYSGNANEIFGRTEESMKLDAAFQRSQNFQLYQQMFPTAKTQDIDDAIFLSAWAEGGISAETLLAHPEIMKGLAKGQKVSEGFIESIKNGWMSDQIEEEISKFEADIMDFKTEITPELEKELDKLDEEAAKYSEQPLNGNIINRAFKGAAQQSHLILEGMRQGVPYGLTAGGMATIAGNAGPQALMPEELITVPTAFSMGMSWGTLRHIQERESTAVFRELRRMTDSNGNKIDLNTVRYVAHVVGGINTAIEFFQLKTLAKFFPGGERFLTGITTNATKNLIENPNIAKNLVQKIVEWGKNIGTEVFQEELQEIIPVIAEEGTKYFNNQIKGTDFAYATPEEIFEKLKEIGIDTILSTTVLAGLGAVTHGASKTTQYLRERKYKNLLNDTAKELNITPEELEAAINEAVQEAKQDPSVASSQERQDPSVGQATSPLDRGDKIQNQENKTDFVFVPEESLENFNAENPADAVEPVFNSNGEAALTPEQFEQVKNADKNFVIENNNDIRYGSDGVTLTENINKINTTDNETSIRFHSKEIQNEVNEVRQQLINTGNDEQEASDAANILGIALSNIYESEGEKAEVTVQQAPEAKPIEYTRIQDENYELSQPETFPNQERAEELNRSLTLETVADDADLAKALKETLTGENKNALDEIPSENVVQPNLSDENAKGIRKKATGILREELKDLQAEYDNSVIETFKGIREKEFDPKKIVIDSKKYQWFNNKNKSRYSFKGKDSRTTNIVIALDGDDAVVKVNPPQKGQQMIFTIKDFRNADLAEILGDLFSGNISDGLALKDSPTAKNVMFALNEFWEENGILEAQDIAEENVRKYNENIEAETKEWEKTVDAVMTGEDIKDFITNKDGEKLVKVMNNTLPSLQLVGAKELPVYMKVDKFTQIGKKHKNITTDMLKEIINEIADPIAIFESKTVPNDIVVMTNIQDEQGATIVIPIALNEQNNNYEINRIKSVYEKTYKKTGEVNNDWFKEEIEAGRTLYANMRKISEWEKISGLYLPPLRQTPIGDKRIIANENDLDKAIRNMPEVNLNDEVRNYTDIEGNVTAFTTWKDLKAFINIIKSGNFAANVHEIGHVVFRVLERLSKSGSIQADKDFQTVLDHAGVTREQFYSEAENKTGGFRETVHEWFAKALEVYMSEGKAPTSKLQALFTRVKNYMLKIYHDIQTQLGIKIDDDVRAVFDRLFAMTDDASTVAEAVDFNSRVSSQINSYNTDIRQAQSELALMDQQSKGLVSVFPQFARTADGDEIGFVYRVMDVRDVITSHEDNGTENKNFPQELQPRHSRDSVASQQQIQKIANNLDPELLADNRQVSEGAPIIGEDDLVESGNARSIAIRKAYNEGNAENYKNYLVENAEKFGLNPDAVKKIERPVLVRVHLANMDENLTREDFVLKANEAPTLKMTSSETALGDASRINIKSLSLYDYTKSLGANKDFLGSLVNSFTETDRGALLQEDGNISLEGMLRVQNALAAKAYGDTGIIKLMTEATDNAIKNVTNALSGAASRIALLEEYIKNGNIDKEFSIKNDVMQAVNMLKNIREQGLTVSEFLAQPNMFDGDFNMTEAAESLLKFFSRNSRSAKTVLEGLVQYSKLALKELEGGNLFGDNLNKTEMLQQAFNQAMSKETPKSYEEVLQQNKPIMEMLEKQAAPGKESNKIKEYKAAANEINKALKDENKRIQAEYKTELENVNKSHEGEIRQLEREHNAEIKSIEVKAQKEIKALEKEVEKLTKKQGENSQEIENLKLKNQEKIEKINEKYEKQKGELKEKHKQKISDLRLQRDEKINKIKEQFKEKTAKNKQKFNERLAKKVEKLTGRTAKLGKTVVNLKKQIKQKQERINNLTSVIKERNSKNNINKMVKGITAMAKGHNVFQYELDEIHALLDKYDLKRKGKENRQKQELIYSYLKNEGKKYTSDILEKENITQEDIQAFTKKTHLEFMTLAEVKELYDKVREIYQRGRESYKQWEEARNQRISAMQNSMAQDIISKTKVPENTVPTQPEDLLAKKTTETIRWVYNATKMTGRVLHGLGENFRKFAGDNISKAHGVASENIYRREAELAEKIRRKSKGLNPARDFSKHAITLDGKSYNWNEVMAVYLYSLNEKGYQALLWGNFVQNAANKDKLYKTQEEGESAIAKLIQFLHENEIYKNAADLMKDDFEANYPRIRQSQIDATAKGMGKEENYFPLFRMQRKTSKGIMEIMIDNIIDNGDKQNQLIPNVDDGFTISRAEISENSQQPVILDAYGNWQRGVRQQENYAAFRGVISELTSALIRNGDNGSVQQLIKKRLGMSYWRDLVNILKHSVKDSAMAEQDAGNLLVNIMKRNQTVSALSFNSPVAFGQTASYFAGVAKMFHETGIHGAGHVLRSVINALRGGKSFMENVYKLMPELRYAGGDVESRAYREQRRINRYSEKHPFIGDFRNLYHKFISFGLSWNGFFDRVTKAIVFDGAYNSYLENGYDVEEAVRLARRVVQDTQPPSFSRETTALNRSPSLSWLMLFTNALTPIYNMTVVDTVDALREQGTWNAVKQAALYVSATALGALWIGFIRDLFWRRLPTGEELPNGEEDNYVRWAAYTAIDGMANTIPLYSAAYKDWRMSANYRYSFNTDPFSGPFRKIARGSKLFFGEDYEGRRTEGVLNMLDGLSNLGVIPSFPTTSARMLYRWFAPRE